MSTEGNSYEAKAFAPESKGITLSGRVEVTATTVRFESGDKVITLPLQGLLTRTGGYNGAQLFLEHADFPGVTIYSSDPRFARDPHLANHPAFAQAAKLVEKNRKGTPIGVYLVVGLGVLIVLMIVAVLLAKDPLVRFAANRIPLEWEQKIGDQLFQGIQAEGKLLTNSLHQKQLDVITSRLVPAVKEARHRFVFHIMQDTNVNAFAMPGGHVVVFTGLLEQADSPEEVAGVLGHELAHVTQRHSLRKLIETVGLFVLIDAVIGDVGGMLAILTEGSRLLLEQKFSRNFERESDDLGWDYLIQAEIDPRGMTSFFRKLEKLDASGGSSGALALLSTHPATRERIEGLEKKWDKMDPKPKITPLENISITANKGAK